MDFVEWSHPIQLTPPVQGVLQQGSSIIATTTNLEKQRCNLSDQKDPTPLSRLPWMACGRCATSLHLLARGRVHDLTNSQIRSR
jgi:hypothetical protein